jgi:hypothetical protein
MLTTNQRRRFSDKFVELEKEASLKEPVIFSWLQPSEQPPTGCWSFVDNTHRIRVNIDCANKSSVKTARGASSFAEMIARHEFGHALYTERDFKAANEMCKRVKCSFRLFNLFEDARIEHTQRFKSGVPFRWLKWERPAEPKCPVGIFFWLIQNEIMPYHSAYSLIAPNKLCLKAPYPIVLARRGRSKIRRTMDKMMRDAGSHGIDTDVVMLVFRIFVEVTRTPNTMSLEAWLKRWMELFPQTNGEGNGIGEVVAGSHNGDQIAPEEITADNVPVATADGEKGANGKAPSEGSDSEDAKPEDRSRDETVLAGEHSDTGEKIKKGMHIVKGLYPDELQEGAQIANLMSRGFRCRGEDKIKTLSSSKRLNVRDIAVGNIAKPFIRTEVQSKGVPKVAVVMDFSGSMMGNPSKQARIFLFALNRLVKAGLIKCKAFATRSGDGCYTEQTLPCRVENINWQAVGGSEGMRLFFTQKMSELQEFDTVIVFTDGDIGDAGTDFRSLHSRGIFVVGAYVSNISPEGLLEQQRQLSRYFDKGIARPDMASLASDITRLITNSR